MNACTIFSYQDDLFAIYDRLRHLYGPSSVSVEGEENDYTSLTLTIRKLFKRSSVTLNIMRETGGTGPLEDMKMKMHHVFQTVPAERKEIQDQLLRKIRGIRLAIGVVTEGKMRGFEDAIFSVAKLLNGMVFWEGNQMLDPKGRLILNFKGHCRVKSVNLEDMPPEVLPDTEFPAEAVARKARNLELLDELGVPVHQNWHPIEATAEARLRTEAEVADRALALVLVALKGEGLEQAIVERIAADFEIMPHLSPAEAAFIADPAPDQQHRVNFAWRYEALWTLLWALGFVDVLAYPGAICDVQTAVLKVRDAGSRAAFHEAAQLRETAEILDQADLIFRLNWACVDARLRGEDAPAELEKGVVYERHYTLNWLRSHLDADWDHVRTDT
ncbi:MAG: DUF4272 domain-containing protein [Bacteroidota bacterium]